MHRSKTDKPNTDKQPENPTPALGWNVNGHGSNNNQPPAPGWNVNGHGINNNNNQFYNKPTEKSGLIRYIRIKLFRVFFISW